jgi:hypothetical protein
MGLKRLNDSCHCATAFMCYGLHEYTAHFLQVLGSKTEKIWGFHGGDCDDYHFLGDDTVWLL